MDNIFNMVNSYILKNTNIPYGELNNIGNKNFIDTNVKNICSNEEYLQYKELQKMDKHKLLNISNNSQTKTKQQIQQKQKPQEIYVSGIGLVTQIC